MENFDPELLARAKQAKSAEELLVLAAETGTKMSKEQAKAYYAHLHPTSGELTDEELDNVAGGGCSAGIVNSNDERNLKKVKLGDRVRLRQCSCRCGNAEPVGTVVRIDSEKIFIDPDCCHCEVQVGGANGFKPALLSWE